MILAELGKYLMVFLTSMLKFVGGPVLGTTIGLSFLETSVFTVLGMMTTVIIISYFGVKLRKWWMSKKQGESKTFTKRNRRIVYIWRNYGEFGVSFLTPVVFSPVIGTLVVTTLGGKRRKVFAYMLFSAIFWSLVLSLVLNFIITV